MSTNIQVKCLECGNIYSTGPYKILSGCRCRQCAIKERDNKHKGINVKKTHEQFILELNQINKNIMVIDKYQNAKTPLRCKCKICNEEWMARPTNLLTNKTGCPLCGYKSNSEKQLKSHKTFTKELAQTNNNIIPLEKYKGNHRKILCKCNICDNEWQAIPSNLLKGEGCPRCRASHGEVDVSNWLENNNIKYETQKRFHNLVGIKGRTLPYDFYVPDYNCLIEYQGNFHDHTDRIQSDEDFEQRKIHDKLKKEYAISNKYNFLEIWYYDNIEEKLKEMFNIIDPVTTIVT